MEKQDPWPMLVAALVEALPDPALLLRRDGMVEAANSLARETLGLNPQGQHLSAAIRAPAVLAAFAEALLTRKTVRAVYDERVPVPRSFEAVLAPLGVEPAALLVLRDLSRAISIERMRSDFVANASHELRTPLAAIHGFIETLEGPARNDQKAQVRFLKLMKQEAVRMSRLIGDLLSLGRIEASEHQRPAASADLADVAALVRDRMLPMAAEAGCALVLNAAAPLKVRGEPEELGQALQNLVENAIRYGHQGKRIEISLSQSPDHAELAVRDHGPGIAAEHLPRLTERFYRVSAAVSRERGGTGLGLAIVKHILNRHRGRLVVTSQPGAGSSFVMMIPLM